MKEREKRRYETINLKRKQILSTYEQVLRDFQSDADIVRQCFTIIFPSVVDDEVEPKAKLARTSGEYNKEPVGGISTSTSSSSSSVSHASRTTSSSTVAVVAAAATTDEEDTVQWEDGSDAEDEDYLMRFEPSCLADIVNSAALGSENYEIVRLKNFRSLTSCRTLTKCSFFFTCR